MAEEGKGQPASLRWFSKNVIIGPATIQKKGCEPIAIFYRWGERLKTVLTIIHKISFPPFTPIPILF